MFHTNLNSIAITSFRRKNLWTLDGYCLITFVLFIDITYSPFSCELVTLNLSQTCFRFAVQGGPCRARDTISSLCFMFSWYILTSNPCLGIKRDPWVYSLFIPNNKTVLRLPVAFGARAVLNQQIRNRSCWRIGSLRHHVIGREVIDNISKCMSLWGVDFSFITASMSYTWKSSNACLIVSQIIKLVKG